MIHKKCNHSHHPYYRRNLPPCHVRQGGGQIINRHGLRYPCPGADNRRRRMDRHMDPDHCVASLGAERDNQPKHNHKPCIITACYRLALCQKRGYCHVKKCKRRHGNGAYRQRNQKALHINSSVLWPMSTARQYPCPYGPHHHTRC